jgi:hypothetical protein
MVLILIFMKSICRVDVTSLSIERINYCNYATLSNLRFESVWLDLTRYHCHPLISLSIIKTYAPPLSSTERDGDTSFSSFPSTKE